MTFSSLDFVTFAVISVTKSITAKYTTMTEFSISLHKSPEIRTHTLLRISESHESRGHKFCVRDTENVSDFVQKHFVSATNVSQFAQHKKHHEQQCVRNNVSSFARAFKFVLQMVSV